MGVVEKCLYKDVIFLCKNTRTTFMNWMFSIWEMSKMITKRRLMVPTPTNKSKNKKNISVLKLA